MTVSHFGRPRPNQYERHYARLQEILGQPLDQLDRERVYRLEAPGFMDLVIEVLPDCATSGARILSLAHYFEQNGDLCQDPEMTVRLFPPGSTLFTDIVPRTAFHHGRLEALTFQQAIPPIYQKVLPRARNLPPPPPAGAQHLPGRLAPEPPVPGAPAEGVTPAEIGRPGSAPCHLALHG